ncbi:MAG: outer membrane beta-barrel protein [Proteobacteria bacterium]|nr:outer membrane beta-barrel protein [Pseudomonadota bacterium]
MHPKLPIAAFAALLMALFAAPASAEIRGGSFEAGGVGGAAVWSSDLGLKPCGWYGGFAGHRFQPLAERLHLGFRAAWEGCVTQQRVTDERVDMILVDVGFSYGVRVLPWMLPYGFSGGGFLIADSTPSGGDPTPRTVFQTGGGVAITLGPYLLLDIKVRLLVFENIQFGSIQGQFGSVVSPLFAIALGAQI